MSTGEVRGGSTRPLFLDMIREPLKPSQCAAALVARPVEGLVVGGFFVGMRADGGSFTMPPGKHQYNTSAD